MRRFYIIGFLILTACDTLAQCGIKLAALHAGPLSFDVQWVHNMIQQRWLWFALGGYVGAFFSWMTLLRHAPVGPAFAASHFEKVVVVLVSVLWLGEKVSLVQALGCLFIIGGIALLGYQQPGPQDARDIG